MNLLDGVNRVLKRARLIQGDSSELPNLTSGKFQADVDIIVSAWSEVVRYVFDHDNVSKGLLYGTSEGTITLVTGQREYSLPADFDVVSSPVFVNQTLGNFLTPYPGGFTAMHEMQMKPGDFSGLPAHWTLNPTTGKIRLDSAPESAQNGAVYTFLYEKRHNLSMGSDEFPFSDSVVEDLVPAVAQIWRREAREQFDALAFNVAVGQAVTRLTGVEIRSRY